MGTNVVLSATGLGVVKVVDKVAPGVTKQAVDAVKDKVDNIRNKDSNTAEDLKAKPDAEQTDQKADTDAPTSQDVDKHCCFVAGTLVQTETGLRPIETLQVGD